MSLTYKIAACIVRLLGVKKIFRKSKKDILEYAKKQNEKPAFDRDKAMKRDRRKKYFFFDRKVMGHRVLPMAGRIIAVYTLVNTERVLFEKYVVIAT